VHRERGEARDSESYAPKRGPAFSYPLDRKREEENIFPGEMEKGGREVIKK